MRFLPNYRPLSRIPIKWKLTLWSALLLFLLFTIYSTVQYFYIEKWLIQHEKAGIQQNMNEMLNYFLERETGFEESELPQMRQYLNKVVQKDQFIRVTREDGSRMLFVSGGLSEQGVAPVQSTTPQWTRLGEHSILVMSSPLVILNFKGTVEIASSIDNLDRLSEAFWRLMMVSGLGVVMLSAFGGGILAWQLLKPLQSMAATIKSIKDHGLQERMSPSNNQDEIATLMNLFNEMMDQVERAFRQQSQFVEDASHELRTPIAIIEGHLGMLRRWGKDDPAVLGESLEIAYHEIGRLRGLVQELLVLSLEETADSNESVAFTNPAKTAATVVKHIASLDTSIQYRINVNSLEDITLPIPEARLEQILLILLDNAVKFTPAGGTITISGFYLETGATLEIADTGIGIPAKDLPYVMDRFYRVDAARNRAHKGHGLGLAIAQRLTEKYGGTLTIRSEELKGTAVTLTFPLI